LILTGIRPKQIAEQSFQRGLLKPVDFVYVIYLLKVWGDTSMHAEVLSISNRHYRHCLKSRDDLIIHLYIEFLTAFVSKREVLGHIFGLVVASEKDDGGWKAEFQAEEKQNALDPKHASVHIVPQKQIIELFGFSSFVDHMAEVIVLSMDVSYDYKRLFHVN
jgi:hypothetical protein